MTLFCTTNWTICVYRKWVPCSILHQRRQLRLHLADILRRGTGWYRSRTKTRARGNNICLVKVWLSVNLIEFHHRYPSFTLEWVPNSDPYTHFDRKKHFKSIDNEHLRAVWERHQKNRPGFSCWAWRNSRIRLAKRVSTMRLDTLENGVRRSTRLWAGHDN